MSVAACLRMDLRLQARSRLYAVGVLVSVGLGLLGRFLIGPEHAAVALPILYLFGLGGTTYIFSASTVLLEKGEGTLQALRTSPLTADAYLLSKTVTLTAFAIVEGAIVHAVGFWGAPFALLPLAAGVLSLGLLNTFVGLGQVAPHDSVLGFLIPGALLVGSAMQWPFLYALEVGPPALWYLFPTQGPLLLLLGAFRPLEPWQWVYAVGMSLAAVVVSGWWLRRRFRRYIALQER